MIIIQKSFDSDINKKLKLDNTIYNHKGFKHKFQTIQIRMKSKLVLGLLTKIDG